MNKLKSSYEEDLTNEDILFDLKSDLVFKTIMNSIEGRSYLSKIISIATELDYNYVFENLEIVNNEIPINNINQSKSISDLMVDTKREKIIVEMNKFKTPAILNKGYYYALNLYVSKVNNDNDYTSNENIWLINIDNYDVLKKNDFIYRGSIRNDTYNICLIEQIKFIHINLEYLRKKYYNNIEMSEVEEKFIIFILNNKNKVRNITHDESIESVIKKMEELKRNKDFVISYDKEKFDKVVMKELKEIAQKEGREEGHREGLEEGKKEGKKEGIKEGIKEGKLELAKDLLKKGVNIEIIKKCSGLTDKELNRINK